MSKPTTWHVQINGGPEQTFVTKTGIYQLAVVTAIAVCDYEPHDDYDVVKIWVPELLPDYGPYFYGVESKHDGYVVGQPHDNRKW
jgi:hypothetical protein